MLDDSAVGRKMADLTFLALDLGRIGPGAARRVPVTMR